MRSVGELVENQFRIGVLRMERVIKEKMSSLEIETVMPQDLINAKPVTTSLKDFFGASQLSQIWVPPSALNPTKNLKGGKIIIPNLASDVKLTTHSISVDGILNQKTWCFSFDDG